jgi:hypothetical protein
MTCLNNTEIQAVVDGEASAESQSHVAACDRCRDRVAERRRDMETVTGLMAGDADVPPLVEARLRAAILEGRPARGATSLRGSAPGRWRLATWLSATAAAAGVALVMFLVLPKLGAPTSLSASEVLGRSLKTLTATTGVEMLEYQFFVAGEMPGPHRIEQLIDHDRPGRFRFSNYGPDGVLESAMGQDPATNRSVQLIRVDGRNYVITLAAGARSRPSFPEMAQALVETAITMMQATSDQSLTTVDTPAGRQYVVEMPPVTPASSAAMFDLYRARAAIDERDYRIQEFEASGSLLKQPYSVTFRLIQRAVRPSSEVPAEEFMIAAGPGDVVLAGQAEHDPVTDVLTTALRELGKKR